jgi:hypothetical protein
VSRSFLPNACAIENRRSWKEGLVFAKSPMQCDRLELLRRIKVKNRSVLYVLAIGALTAAPVFADKIPEAAIKHEGNSVSVGALPAGFSLRDAAIGQSIGLGAFKDSNAASHIRTFDQDGKLAIMNDRSNTGSSGGIGEVNFLPMGSTHSAGSEKPDTKGVVKHTPVDVGHEGPSLPPVAVPEPEAFTLVLVGVGVLGMLLYRRNSQ